MQLKIATWNINSVRLRADLVCRFLERWQLDVLCLQETKCPEGLFPSVLFAVIWFALQLLQGTSELLSPDMAGGIAWWAHIGGFAFGALFALAAHVPGPPHPVPTTTWSGPMRGRGLR